MKDRELKFRIRIEDVGGNVTTHYLTVQEIMGWMPAGKPITIDEYTGLNDKEGKEIYEGDICLLDILGTCERKHIDNLKSFIVVIEYKNASFGFRHLYPNEVHQDDIRWRSFWQDEDEDMWDNNYFKLIGNIYENQELLE